MSSRIDKLKEIIRELINQALEEASVTGNIDGGEGPPKTPYAFQSKPKSKKDKDKEKAIATAGGYMKVKEAKFMLGNDASDTATVVVDAGSPGEAKMLISKNLRKGVKAIVSVNRVQPAKAKVVTQKLESISEGRYHDWRNDESMTPKQKIGKSVREVRDALQELDKVIKMNLKLKTELNVDSKNYWKNTHKALAKISERLVKLATKVGSLK